MSEVFLLLLNTLTYIAIALIAVVLFASTLTRSILVEIFMHPLRKTQIEIHDKKHITVKNM